MRFGVVQGERGRSDLEQLAGDTKPGQADPGLGTPGEHQLRALRHVEEQCGEGIQAFVVLELVDVVEHEHERLWPSGQRGDQAGETLRPQRVAGARECLEHGGVERRAGVQRLGDVGQKDDGIVVAVVERDPGELATVVCGPLPENRRLAVTRGCHDADDSTAALTGEAADEPRALDQARPRQRHVDLGPQQLERSRRPRSGLRFFGRFHVAVGRLHRFLRSNPADKLGIKGCGGKCDPPGVR